MTDAVLPAMDLGLAGLHKEIEVALRFAPSFQAAGRAASSLSHMIALHPGIPVRLAGVEVTHSRVHLTIAVTLGAIDDIKVASARSTSSVAFMRALVHSMAAFDPAFVQLPDPASREALQAQQVMITDSGTARRLAAPEPILRSA